MRGIALLTFFVPSLPVCLMRPFYGILLWTVVAFLNPQSYVFGVATSFPVALAVAIPTLAGLLLFVRGWVNRLASREMVLIAILWLWFTLTTVISTNNPMFMHHSEDTWLRWELVSKILLMTVATVVIVETFEQLRILLLVVAGCLGVFVLKSFPFMIATGGAFRLYGPENSMIADNNDFGLALNMTLPLFYFLAQTESRPWLKRVLGFLFVITIPAIFFTYSRGALVGLVVVLALMLFQLKQRLVLLPVILIGLLVAIAFAPERWQQRMNPSGNVVDASVRSRFNAWTFCWNLASDYPFAGGGFATYTPQLFERYAPRVMDVHNSHSVYFGVLAEHGFTGLLLYLALLWCCFSTCRKVYRMARSRDDPAIMKYATMFQFSMAGFLISGLFLSRAYFDYFFTLVACIAILQRVCWLKWNEEETDTVDIEEKAIA